jgi:hypothetical protein
MVGIREPIPEPSIACKAMRSRELSMAKSRAEMMELLANLLVEYAEFQGRRPDLPQGDLRDLSEQELDLLVTEFQRDRAAEADDVDSMPPRPLLH